MTIRFVFVTPAELGPYAEGLRAIERATEYPVGDGVDAFTIDHGADYYPFFASVGQDPRFVVGLDGDRVVGGVVGMYRDVRIRGRMVRGCYGADWKLARDYRGRGVARQMMTWAMGLPFKDPSLRGWRYGYVAAMRGAQGDVMRVVKGLHPGKLVKAAGTLAVYFVEPSRLAALSLDGTPAPPDADDGVDLSYVPSGHVDPPGVVSTAGMKDLRLKSTGQPWPLVHLPYGPSRWKPTWGAYLRACGEALASRLPAVACFAIDERLDTHISWLASQGIAPGATCTVYALDLTLRARRAAWLHLATSEI
ncbi:MAG: GNAT family N-acetyltransferase [Polyangiaceae bacterium]